MPRPSWPCSCSPAPVRHGRDGRGTWLWATVPPATHPLAHAHWKLKPPMRPSTSQDLAAQEETGTDARLHRGEVDLGERHAAGGHLRLGPAAVAGHGQRLAPTLATSARRARGSARELPHRRAGLESANRGAASPRQALGRAALAQAACARSAARGRAPRRAASGVGSGQPVDDQDALRVVERAQPSSSRLMSSAAGPDRPKCVQSSAPRERRAAACPCAARTSSVAEREAATARAAEWPSARAASGTSAGSTRGRDRVARARARARSRRRRCRTSAGSCRRWRGRRGGSRRSSPDRPAQPEAVAVARRSPRRATGGGAPTPAVARRRAAARRARCGRGRSRGRACRSPRA